MTYMTCYTQEININFLSAYEDHYIQDGIRIIFMIQTFLFYTAIEK